MKSIEQKIGQESLTKENLQVYAASLLGLPNYNGPKISPTHFNRDESRLKSTIEQTINLTELPNILRILYEHKCLSIADVTTFIKNKTGVPIGEMRTASLIRESGIEIRKSQEMAIATKKNTPIDRSTYEKFYEYFKTNSTAEIMQVILEKSEKMSKKSFVKEVGFDLKTFNKVIAQLGIIWPQRKSIPKEKQIVSISIKPRPIEIKPKIKKVKSIPMTIEEIKKSLEIIPIETINTRFGDIHVGLFFDLNDPILRQISYKVRLKGYDSLDCRDLTMRESMKKYSLTEKEMKIIIDKLNGNNNSSFIDL